MISMLLQILTGSIAAGVFVLCLDHLRRTHPRTHNPVHWTLALCFCIVTVSVIFSALQMTATLGDLAAGVGAGVWLIDTWEDRYATTNRHIFYPTPRELQTIELPLNTGRRS